ncbi:MAG TPA: DUF423 domain-containing protein [Myxococcota bacterium]|jgi:uncharacterized membrane protein YgdD (TMEM256/DUF423 family)|nr:DUF423 domain-containing protein [Myxococcota bacterium]
MPWIPIAASLGALGVILGAFGAHALRARIDPAQLATWQTAVQYHLLHAVALLAVALWSEASGRDTRLCLALFGVGIVLFSGSLYLLVLGGPRWLGPVTPLGGLCLICGWLALAWTAARAGS